MITILRLGHRPSRDKRITTHVGLVARAFNADSMMVDTKDPKLESNIASVGERFGGGFKVETGVSYRSVIRNWEGTIVHLTMYGEHVDDVMQKLKSDIGSNLLVIIGSTKVPREIYERADFNVAIGHQPHSEVAALALFLDRYFKGRELKTEFSGKLNIQGSKKDKIVIETKEQ